MLALAAWLASHLFWLALLTGGVSPIPAYDIAPEAGGAVLAITWTGPCVEQWSHGACYLFVFPDGYVDWNGGELRLMSPGT